MNDAGDRAAVDDQRGRHSPAGIASHECAGAVDRIHDEEDPPPETLEIVSRLLGQPSRLGERIAKALFQEHIGGQIRFRDRGAARLGVNLGGGRRPHPEKPERQRARLACGGGQAVASVERAPVGVDVQRGVRGARGDSKPGL